MVFTFILIFICVILLIELDKKKKELDKVKQENLVLHQNIFKMANKLNGIVIKGSEDGIVIPENKSLNNVSNFIQKKEINRNNVILITGSIFIIISAILFLTSTWNFIPNTIKVSILSLLIFVFLGISNFADKKFNLSITSKAFYYIAMFYIPIVLYSFSYLKLIGNYFSVGGVGFYLYLSISSFVISAIYIFSSKKDKNLIYFNYLFQILGVIFIGLYIKIDYQIIYLLLTFYNMAIVIKNIYFKSIYSSNVGIVLLCCLMIYSILSTLISAVMYNMNFNYFNIYILISNIVMFISVIFDNMSNSLFVFAKDVLLISLVLSICAFLRLNIEIQELSILLSLILLYINCDFVKKNVMLIEKILLLGGFVLLFFISLYNSYIISLIVLLIVICICIRRYLIEKNLKYVGFIVWLILISYLLLVDIFNLDYFGFILLLLLSEIIKTIILSLSKKMEFNNVIEINSNIILIPNFILYAIFYILDESSSYVFIPLIWIFTNYFNYKKANKKYSLFFLYFASALFLETLNNWLQFPINKYFSFLVVSFIIMCIQFYKNRKFDDYKIFAIFYAISLICNISVNSHLSFIFSFIVIIVNFIYNERIEKDKSLELLSYVFMSLLIYSDVVILQDFNINVILSLIIICLFVIRSLINKERVISDWFALAYLVLDYIIYDIDYYLFLILIIVWSIVNFDKNKKGIDIVKFILYLSSLLLYNNLVIDFGISDITLIKLFGYFVFFYLLTFTIIKKKNSNFAKAVEYLSFIVLNMNAINLYMNVFDGVLFITFLVTLVFIGYLMKIESLFYMSILFIFIDLFLLTREFWYSIPWWLYLLLIGICLILFAINNETHTNIKNAKLLNKIRDHFNN